MLSTVFLFIYFTKGRYFELVDDLIIFDISITPTPHAPVTLADFSVPVPPVRAGTHTRLLRDRSPAGYTADSLAGPGSAPAAPAVQE